MDLIIGLVGAKGAGKSTAFGAFSSQGDTVEIMLAGKLKEVCSKVLSIPREHFDSHAFKEKSFPVPAYLSNLELNQIFKEFELNPNFDKYIRPHIGKMLHSPRQVAQYVGTEVLRAVDPDIHCKAAIRGKSASIGVVTDIRFPNELDFFLKQSLPFVPVYIKNPRAEYVASGDVHVSESYLKDLAARCYFTIENSTSLESFEKDCKNFIFEITKNSKVYAYGR